MRFSIERLHRIYARSPCVQDHFWRWGILLALLILMAIFGG